MKKQIIMFVLLGWFTFALASVQAQSTNSKEMKDGKGVEKKEHHNAQYGGRYGKKSISVRIFRHHHGRGHGQDRARENDHSNGTHHRRGGHSRRG